MVKAVQRLNISLSNYSYKGLNLLAMKAGEVKSKYLIDLLLNYVSNPYLLSTRIAKADNSFNFYIENSKLNLLEEFVQKEKIESLSSLINDLIYTEIKNFLESLKFVIQRNFENGSSMNLYKKILNNYSSTYLEVCHDALDENPDEVIFAYSPEQFYKHFSYEYDLEKYIPKRVSCKIFSRGLIPRTEFAKDLKQIDKKSYRITKILPNEFKFQMSMILYNDTVAFLSHKDSSVIVVNNELVTDLFRSDINYLWNMSV